MLFLPDPPRFDELTSDSEAEMASWRAGKVTVHADGHWSVERRFWGKNASLAEVWLLGGWTHHWQDGGTCSAYWHMHPSFPQYLCLGYIVSQKSTSVRTLYRTQNLVSEIARIKRADAVLCDVVNQRISDRLLARWGWERHVPDSKRRLFIKRFYGEYPATEKWIQRTALATTLATA